MNNKGRSVKSSVPLYLSTQKLRTVQTRDRPVPEQSQDDLGIRGPLEETCI